MSRRIHSKYKVKLGDLLEELYARYGKVLPRKPYHEDDQGDVGGAKPIFIEHPFLQNLPVGASSDLTHVVENNPQTLDAAEKRSDELTEEPKQRLTMRLGHQPKQQFIYQNYVKPI